MRDIADARRWCAIDNECRGLDAALTDGHAGGICAAEYEADSVVVKEDAGVTVVKHLNDLEKMMKLPFRLRIFHVRANDKHNPNEDAYKHDLAKEKVSEVVYANRANILQEDQVFVSIATTSDSKTFHHSIGYWRRADSEQWPEDDTLWADFDAPV